MGKRIFRIEFEMFDFEIDNCLLELDQEVIDAVDCNWRDSLYELYTPEDIAVHIAANMVINNLTLSGMDGWADKSDKLAKLLTRPELNDFDITAIEVTKVKNNE